MSIKVDKSYSHVNKKHVIAKTEGYKQVPKPIIFAAQPLNPYFSQFPQMNLGFNNFSSPILPAIMSFFMMPQPIQWGIGLLNNFTHAYNTKTDIAALKKFYNANVAGGLAKVAEHTARVTNTIGRCAKGVMDSMANSHLANNGSRVASAYQEAGKLYDNKNFAHVDISRNDLQKLPAGCVIVWQASEGHPHGHIAVTLGNGQEASDHVQNLISQRNARYDVFVPTKNKQNC